MEISMKCLKWIAAITLSMTCLSTLAATIPATTIADNYIGAGYNGDVNGAMNHWDISSMTVSRDANGIMTVDILTSFYNDIGRSGIVMGDLFMATEIGANGTPWNPSTPTSGDRFSGNNGNNTGTNWDHAYTIDAGDRDNINGYRQRDGVSGGGYGRLVNGFDNNDLVHSNAGSGHRANQAVYLQSGAGTELDGASSYNDGWNNEGYTRSDGSWYGTLSFSFDTTGTALENANQIAFRWAMSCANDIIEGLVSISGDGTGGGTSVPEPQTILLMLLALAGITYRRKQRGFEA